MVTGIKIFSLLILLYCQNYLYILQTIIQYIYLFYESYVHTMFLNLFFVEIHELDKLHILVIWFIKTLATQVISLFFFVF